MNQSLNFWWLVRGFSFFIQICYAVGFDILIDRIMESVVFETLKTAKPLQAASFEQGQAEVLTEEFKSVVQSNFAKLATQEQVAQIAKNQETFATQEQVDSKFKLLSWMIGFCISLNLLILGVFLFFLFSYAPQSVATTSSTLPQTFQSTKTPASKTLQKVESQEE